jgi:hypothetical protein
LTIKAGSSSVKIYRESREDGSVYYKLSYHLGGKRHRPSFADLDEAKTEATAKAAQLSRGDIDAMQLNGSDRLAYGRALEAVRQFNIPLDAAAIDYAEVRKVLGNHSLMEAARFYMRHNAAGIMGKPVTEAFEEFKKAKKDAGRNAHYLRVDIGSRCGAFAKAFKMEVRQLTGEIRLIASSLRVRTRPSWPREASPQRPHPCFSVSPRPPWRPIVSYRPLPSRIRLASLQKLPHSEKKTVSAVSRKTLSWAI